MVMGASSVSPFLVSASEWRLDFRTKQNEIAVVLGSRGAPAVQSMLTRAPASRPEPSWELQTKKGSERRPYAVLSGGASSMNDDPVALASHVILGPATAWHLGRLAAAGCGVRVQWVRCCSSAVDLFTRLFDPTWAIQDDSC